MPNQNHLNLVFLIADCLFMKTAGIQNKITHQYSFKLRKISFGKTPKTEATKKPIKPEDNRSSGE